MSNLKFIDLYAGLGGFHQALVNLGHECVWASEINYNLRELYKRNYPGVIIEGDIFEVDIDKIPKHDIICAGFPCQPFSRAGKRLGLNDKKNGNHFYKIIELIESKGQESATYIILENVETLIKHDNGRSFSIISKELKAKGYEIDYKVLSPHQFNIPHHRKRLFIVGSKKGLENFDFPEVYDINNTTIKSIIDKKYKIYKGEKLKLNSEQKKVISYWEKFVKTFPKNSELPFFPIWSHEWGADYDYKDKTPFSSKINELIGRKGKFGKKIEGSNKKEIINSYIPRYSSIEQEKFPEWKIRFIEKNRELYKKNKKFIDDFMKKNPEYLEFEFSNQKFEWNCTEGKRTFSDKIIQFRPSGLRIKKNNWVPALNTISTQSVYLPQIKRKLSISEFSQLQSFNLKHLPNIENGKYEANGAVKAFGNSVNVKVVQKIAKNLLN